MIPLLRHMPIAILVACALPITGCALPPDDGAAENVTTGGAPPTRAPEVPEEQLRGPTGAAVRADLEALATPQVDTPPRRSLSFPIGAKVGTCTNLDPEPERDGLRAAILRVQPAAQSITVANREVLVARCGSRYVALARWGTRETGFSVDQFARGATQSWNSTAGRPPCGLPTDALRLWKLTRLRCGD